MRVLSVSKGCRTSVEVLLAMPPASAARTRSAPMPRSAAGGPAVSKDAWIAYSHIVREAEDGASGPEVRHRVRVTANIANA